MSAWVQTFDGGDADTGTAVFPQPVTAGNVAVIGTRNGGTATNPGLADNFGSTWTLIDRVTVSTTFVAEAWICLNLLGSGTLTITMGGGAIGRVDGGEISGITTPSLDQHTSAQGTSASANSGAIVTAQPAFIVAFLGLSAYPSAAVSAGSGYTLRANGGNKYGLESTTGDVAAGSYSGIFTLPESNTFAAIIASIKGATVAPPSQSENFASATMLSMNGFGAFR